MLHVYNDIDRISCYFDYMAEITAERSFSVILNVQIRFLHASKYMIWHKYHPHCRNIGQVGTFFVRNLLFPYRTWSPSWIFEWQTYWFFLKSMEYVCESVGLYHNLKESSAFGQLSAELDLLLILFRNGVISCLSGVSVHQGRVNALQLLPQ